MSSDSDRIAPRSATSLQPARACDVGLVFALGMESGCFEDRLGNKVSIAGHGFTLRDGWLSGRHIAVVISGPGRAAAARATEALWLGHRPSWIISAGFAGGLDTRLKQGDLLMADSLVGLRGEQFTIDLQVDARQQGHPPAWHVGRLLTVDRVICKPAEKRQLGKTHAALAVDMETVSVAETCSRNKTRFLSVRVITDTIDQELPADVEKLLHKTTAARRVGAALGAIVRRPGSVKDLWRLREVALVSAERLAKFLEGVIDQLVPRQP